MAVPGNDQSVKGVPGIPIDFIGGPTVDPTKNVLDLVQAAVARLDDLRDAESRRLDERAAAERSHIREIMKLTAEYEDKLASAEAKRIDAIRAVDVGAVAVAAERATQQATVLAAQVATSAETLRTLVQTSATALATQQTAIMEPITTRIAALERTSYEGAGKAGVTDPQMALLLSEMRATREQIAQGSGVKQGSTDMRIVIFGTIAAIATIFGVIVGVISLTSGG